MKRVNAIYRHPLYQTYYRRLEEAEQGRIFCRHQMTHLLDVARIAYIRSLEEGLGLDREVIYAAAVLHDIGKVLQYEEGIPHEITGEKIAAEILDGLAGENAFSETEKAMILTAIRGAPEAEGRAGSSGAASVRERQGVQNVFRLPRRAAV